MQRTCREDDDAHSGTNVASDVSGSAVQGKAEHHQHETATRSGPSAFEGDDVECWICRDPSSTPENPMVADRCLCVGSVGFVHQECIDMWVLENNHLTCSSCGAHYRIASTGLPEGVSYPTTLYGRLRTTVVLLVLPVLRLTIQGVSRILLFWLCESLLLGLVLFWQRFARSPSSSMRIPLSPWDILNATLYGFVLLNMMRAARNGYWSWVEFLGWPKPPAAFEGVDAEDLELSSNSEASDEEQDDFGEEEADDNDGAVDDDGGDWVTSSDAEQEERDDNVHQEDGVDIPNHAMDGAEEQNAPHAAPFPPQGPHARPLQGVQLSRANSAWRIFHFVRKGRKYCGVHRATKVLLRHALEELIIGAPLTFCFGSVHTTALLAVALMIVCVVWRIKYPRKRLREPTRRYDEVGERKGDATELDAYLWFCTYFTEMTLFSVFLPVIIGAVAHYAVSPYFVPFPPSFEAFVNMICPVQILIYWVLGSMGAFALMQMEALVMVPLFAPGVDLYFIRSVDLQFTINTDYWRFILTQAFDADPLVIVSSFVRMTLLESVVLFLFLRPPAAFIYHCANAFATVMHGEPRPLPPPIGVPVHLDTGYSYFIILNFVVNYPWHYLFGVEMQFDSRKGYFLTGAQILLTMWALAFIMATVGFVRLQRLQLWVLRPFVLFVGRHVVHMEHFLFDKERLALVDTFLQFKDIDRLVMPMVPVSEVFNRRQLVLPRDQCPSRLSLRMVVFSALFFVYSATIFWLLPAALFSILAVFINQSFTLLMVGVVAIGLVVDAKSMCTTVIPVCLCVPLLLLYVMFLLVLSIVSLFAVDCETRARDAIDFHHNVRQTVSAFKSPRVSSDTPASPSGASTRVSSTIPESTAATDGISEAPASM